MQTQRRTTGERSHSVSERSGALVPGQVATVIGLGLVFWFAAAMAVRVGSTAGFFGTRASAIAFAVAIPVCWLSVLFIKQVARLGAGQLLPGIAIGTMAATFADGTALTWGRSLYGSDPALTILGAAWILWGVGLFLLFAYLIDDRLPGAAR
ncbi:MAG: hypothetical protein NVS2B7_30230 [Herpetosiphon sp.]